MIEIQNFTKRYGKKVAVDDVTTTIKPGKVTGFLGPNGSGKSTTMRAIVGLDTPTLGTVTVNGKRYADLSAPMTEVGALLDAKSLHPGRSAFNNLMALAHTHRIPRSRVNEVLNLVGLSEVAKKRPGGFSLGMGQRLGIAVALLGDPKIIILDEPVNGLDPEGVRWIRELLRSLAAEGRTVFLSSHLMSELSQTADHLVVIGKGKLMADESMDDFLQGAGVGTVQVSSPTIEELLDHLRGPQVSVKPVKPGTVTISGLEARSIGAVAAQHGITLYELTTHQTSLEEAFMDLTRDAFEYRSK
ncbi:ABC transporter ATP-binding protein [Natronoglycomyces albus]|uniref:ABC transporter ATP-binding protein n=1 Tax=Natronoglycomyces albus TaxID=2811108 RepID=A0A895XNL1_9ACTN|nr:ABC transporter ATP-binding protein [Natronoglycomyces albus]QSB04645.1 ABC transporter ATP-binding protein [Natronoglycomyces albus]